MRHDLFTTPLWHIEGAPQELVDELYKGAYKFKEKCSTATRSNIDGYQTPTLDWKEFHPRGIKYIEKVIHECDSQLFESFKIVNWWFNINGKGASNLPHTHPGADIAIVFYLTDSDGLLNFVNPFTMRRFELHSEQFIGLNAKKGDILIFPADLVHYVRPNKRDTDRVSISMNLQLS